jgi:hypothetical protein
VGAGVGVDGRGDPEFLEPLDELMSVRYPDVSLASILILS